jgi:hypothetical protein
MVCSTRRLGCGGHIVSGYLEVVRSNGLRAALQVETNPNRSGSRASAASVTVSEPAGRSPTSCRRPFAQREPRPDAEEGREGHLTQPEQRGGGAGPVPKWPLAEAIACIMVSPTPIAYSVIGLVTDRDDGSRALRAPA